MRRPIILLIMLAVLSGCSSPDRPRDLPRVAPPSTEELHSKATDRAMHLDARLSAAGVLVARPGGAARLAEGLIRDHADLAQLLDSLLVKSPEAGTRLAAALMAVSQGEAKLDFETVLLRQGDIAIPPLMDLLSTEQDWQTTVRALDALGKLRAEVALESVVTGLKHPNSWVQMAAAHALGEIGGPDAAAALTTALDDTSDTVLAAALVAMGRAGLPSASADCALFLTHANPRVRAAAVSALGRLGGPGLEKLKPLLRDPDPGVRYKVQRALKATEGGR